MSPERWQQVDRIWDAALELPPSELEPFLDAACDGDTGLRREVEQLLETGGEARGFLDKPLGRREISRCIGIPEEPEPGSRLGPYLLLRLLGRGGMSTVYLAVREGDPPYRRLALKLCGGALKNTEVVRRFRTEGRILARLDHPNVARLHDSGTSEDGRTFLVMEYVEGTRVDQYCDGCRLPVEERLRLFLDVCSAVAHAHQNALVHRDLKPANVLVTEAGRVKLLDFGIAKLLDPERFSTSWPATRSGIRPMTPGYASPEQVRGQTVTPASDVYSLGVLLFELLTGTSPYRLEGCRPHEIERIVCEEEVKKMSIAVLQHDGWEDDGVDEASRRRGLPRREQLSRRLRGDLDDVVAMALCKEPGRRYGSAEGLAGDLRRHLLGEPVLAPPGSFGSRTRRWGERLVVGWRGRCGKKFHLG